MLLNDLRDEAFAYAEKQGFHENFNLGNKLMLVVSELSEALEADRNGRRGDNCDGCDCNRCSGCNGNATPELFEQKFRGTVEEEIADAVIRLADIAGMLDMDLEWWVRSKMAYNETRPYKHGKKYG
jgi:NTP pyrophosphatase (non-canonical NTP hydrolase)